MYVLKLNIGVGSARTDNQGVKVTLAIVGPLRLVAPWHGMKFKFIVILVIVEVG
jgi:hypothetical protein